jgi:hypothetical protein
MNAKMSLAVTHVIGASDTMSESIQEGLRTLIRTALMIAGLSIGSILPDALADASSAASAGAKPSRMVGVLADIAPEKRERFSCSVYFTGRGNQDVLYERGQSGRVYMNIRGQTVLGRRLESTERSPMKVGDRFYTLYQFGAAKVRLDSRVTSTCPPTAGSCELMRFTGTLTATDAAATETHGVNGACGI